MTARATLPFRSWVVCRRCRSTLWLCPEDRASSHYTVCAIGVTIDNLVPPTAVVAAHCCQTSPVFAQRHRQILPVSRLLCVISVFVTNQGSHQQFPDYLGNRRPRRLGVSAVLVSNANTKLFGRTEPGTF